MRQRSPCMRAMNFIHVSFKAGQRKHTTTAPRSPRSRRHSRPIRRHAQWTRRSCRAAGPSSSLPALVHAPRNRDFPSVGFNFSTARSLHFLPPTLIPALPTCLLRFPIPLSHPSTALSTSQFCNARGAPARGRLPAPTRVAPPHLAPARCSSSASPPRHPAPRPRLWRSG